jgi:hypothetical protein
MVAFPFRFILWGALLAACAGGSPGFASLIPRPESRFGFDGADAYTYLGYERGFASSEGTDHEESEWQGAGQALVQGHVFRLVARLGLGLAYGKSDFSVAASPYERSYFLKKGWGEFSLRLPFGPTEAEDGIQVGLMPLQSDPDAVLFGNYLARYSSYSIPQVRGARVWDSLGSLAPRAEAVRIVLGRSGGPLRMEGGIVRDGNDYSWFGLLSGKAPRKVDWGLGISVYRAFDGGSKLEEPIRDGMVIVNPDDSVNRDTVRFTLIAPMFSARAAIDFASWLGGTAPEGRYGGVFAEAALLGWKDIPYVLPDRLRRIAWTVGARIPTFGWLDVCVAQLEWRYKGDGSSKSNNGTWFPGTYRRPSPWSAGLLLTKRLGAHWEAQARALTYEQPLPVSGVFLSGINFGDPWGPGASRQVRLLGRFAYRLF